MSSLFDDYALDATKAAIMLLTDERNNSMQGPWIPDMSNWRKVIDFSLKKNADNYMNAGWKLIETRSQFIGDDAAIHIYRLGWPIDAGEPVEPPQIDELPSNFPKDSGPSAN